MLADDGKSVWFFTRATKEGARGLKAAVTSSVRRELKQIGIHPPCWVCLTVNDEQPCFVYLRIRPTATEFPILRRWLPWVKAGFAFRARIEPASRYARWMRRDALVTREGVRWTRRGPIKEKPPGP